MVTRTGGCLCRAVRYECAGEPQFALQCHCRDCQLQSGAPHVAAVRMPSADFRITVTTSTLWGIVGIGIIAIALLVLLGAVARFGRR